jgi:two-component system sensor histidine kinase UhpB
MNATPAPCAPAPTPTRMFPPVARKAQSLRLRVSLVLTALAAAFVLAGAALWVRDARLAIAEEITAAHRVAAQWLAVSAQGTASGDPAWTKPASRPPQRRRPHPRPSARSP